jgi:formylglycine-generating enzyme required for sulfatase activity
LNRVTVIFIIFVFCLTVAPSFSLERYNIIVLRGEASGSQRKVLHEMSIEFRRFIDQYGHIDIVANKEERKKIVDAWEDQVSSGVYDEESIVDIGQLIGGDYIVEIQIYVRDNGQAHDCHAKLFDLESGRIVDLVYKRTSESISKAARRLAHQVSAVLSPKGKVTGWVSEHYGTLEIEMGSDIGIEKGMLLIKRQGKETEARLRVREVYPDRVVAEIESGREAVKIGDEVLLDIPEVSEGGELRVIAPPNSEQIEIFIDGTSKGFTVDGHTTLTLWTGRPYLFEARGARAGMRYNKRIPTITESGFDIEIRFSGRLVVQCDVQAVVFVKGEKEKEWWRIGNTGVVHELSEGAYEIKVSTPGYLTSYNQQYLKPGKTANLKVQLEKVEEMALIPGAIVSEGEPKERTNPPRKTELKAFFLDRREVTVEEYRQVFPQYIPSIAHYPENHAVYEVSWDEANRYCKDRGKRLPTETEWERACRGSRDFKFAYANTFNPLMTDARTVRSKIKDYPLSGAFTDNDYGLYDMTGGVWEWCAGDNVDNRAVARGGAWQMRNPEHRAHCAHRLVIPMDTNAVIGFRCAANAE